MKARVLVWTLIGLYVVSPIDLDPGLPFTDLLALAGGILWERKRST